MRNAPCCRSDLGGVPPAKFNGGLAYTRSKLCNLLFTYELARRLAQQGSGVTVTAYDPVRGGWHVCCGCPFPWKKWQERARCCSRPVSALGKRPSSPLHPFRTGIQHGNTVMCANVSYAS